MMYGRRALSVLTQPDSDCFFVFFRLTGETVVNAFDLDRMYTPFFFARVKSYTAFSEQPL